MKTLHSENKYNIICFIYIIIVEILWSGVTSIYVGRMSSIGVAICLLLLDFLIFRNNIMLKIQQPIFCVMEALVSIFFAWKLTDFLSVFNVHSDKAQIFILGAMNFFVVIYYVDLMGRALSFFIRKIRKNINGVIIPATIVFSFGSMFFVFLPSEVMLSNLNDYLISYQEFALSGVLCAIFLSIVLVVVIVILDEKLSSFLINLFFAIMVAMYCQNYFMNGTLGRLNGQIYDWKKHVLETIVNIVIWLLLFVAPFHLYKFKKIYWAKVLLFLSGTIFVMQGTSLIVHLLTAPQEAYKMKNYYFDNSEQYDVGNEENVILFILDAVDNRFALELWEQDSKVYEKYKDFTFYNNTCSVFDETFNSIPQMLSGSSYNTTPVDYGEFYKRMHESGYVINAYNYECGTNFNDVKNYFDNCTYIDANEARYEVHYEGILYNNVMLTLYQTLPNILKSQIDMKKIDFSNLVTYEAEEHPAYYENDDFRNNMDVNLAKDNKRFIIQHIDGAHNPKDGNYVATTEEVLYIVAQYMDDLKECGVYDDSVIVVTSDHGMHDDTEELFQTASTPIFMIKEKNKHEEKLTVTNAPQYHTDILKTILVDLDLYLDEDGERFGNSIYDFSENEIRERKWYNREFKTYYGYYFEYTYSGSMDDLERKVDNGEYIIVK